MVDSGTGKHRYTACGVVTVFRKITGGFGDFGRIKGSSGVASKI